MRSSAAVPYALSLVLAACTGGDELTADDSGEDAIYQLTVTSDVTVEISMDPGATTYTGIALSGTCPLPTSSCIETVTGPTAATRVICQTLTAGDYWLMVDTWAPPSCIPDYDLSIAEVGSCS